MQSRSLSPLAWIGTTTVFLAMITCEATGQTPSAASSSRKDSSPPQVLSDLLNQACSSDSLEWIPEPKRFLIAAKVNGNDAKFKIDTGALGTLLTLKSAKERKLPVIDFNATYKGVGGEGKVYGSPVQRLQLGSVADLTAQRLAVIDLPVLDGIDGLIGGDTLASTNMIIDYRQHKLHVPLKTANLDLLKASLDVGMLAAKLEREGNYLFLTMHIGSEPLRLFVDTGASKTAIGTQAAERLKLSLKASTEKAVGAGDNAISLQTTHIEAMSIGKSQFRDLECVVMPLDYLASYSKTGVDGILGADCLAASGAILSIADAIIVLPPNEVVVSENNADTKR